MTLVLSAMAATSTTAAPATSQGRVLELARSPTRGDFLISTWAICSLRFPVAMVVN